MHDEFPTRPEHWAKHLEGSYADRDQLRTLDGLGHNWLYIDHGCVPAVGEVDLDGRDR
ncbi:MAG: hypothetical protein QOH50_1509 [Kribbellaceae bacterium]|nr:hypothetical protein [Kribbellaceae bacterium]